MEVVSSVAGKVVDLLFGVAIKEISYMNNCSANVTSFKNEVDKLLGMKGRVQQQIDLAKSKGELLLAGVEEWMSKADSKLSDATEFIAEEAEAKKTCFKLRLCINLSTLSRYSKTATKKTSFLLQIQQDGKNFETCVSLPPPTPGFADIYQKKNLENINTQKLTLKKIIEAIEDDNIQIVGINGLGGVGKTTLASEVAASMKNQFADIVFITISQNIDAKMIQEKVQVATSRIIGGEKVLIILDDMWKELKLDEVGIPCGSDYMNCKILLTSRSIDVCNAMNAQMNISVNPLQAEEAWTIFERVVGKRVWDDRLKAVALKIVKECGGLPLFVQAVGKALKNKKIKSWEAALDRLQDPRDEDADFKKKGIMQLKLSYDYLENEVAKSCFLLCCLFPEDSMISLKNLTYYGLGLGIFDNPDSCIQKAKHRVQLAVDFLKSSFLLLPDEDDEFFKMHDLVRDMAILITSKGDGMFWVESGKGLKEWQPKKHLERYEKISLMENRICKLPDHELLFPHLDTFLIQDNQLSDVPDEFFRGMEKLKVLDMSRNKISSLPRTLEQLSELTMLDLIRNESLCEISILGKLTCLVILKLRDTRITNIPEEMGKLTKLRLLDVYGCRDLSTVTPGVISKLIRLEELYLGLKKEGNCEFLVELSELKSLTILHLEVPDLHYIPQDFHFETLIEFEITEPGGFRGYSRGCKSMLQISEFNLSFTMPIMKLIQLSEWLILCWIKDLDNILTELYRVGVEEFKYIQLEGCKDVKRLVMTCNMDATHISNELGPIKTKEKFFSKVERIWLYELDSLEVLWDSPHPYISFCNLATIYIWGCPSLLQLFPLSVAQGLANLKTLEISFCESLVVVISARDEQASGSQVEETCRIEIKETTGGSKTDLVKQEDLDVVFPFLTDIKFYELPKLVSFYSGHSTITYPSLQSIDLAYCANMKRWSYGDNHIPKIKFKHEGKQYSNINDYIEAHLEMSGKLNDLRERCLDDT